MAQSVRAHLRYSIDHEWLEDGEPARVGITTVAADALGEVVFVDLPEVGAQVEAGEPCGELESTKSVSDLVSPVSGTVVAVNEAVVDEPGSLGIVIGGSGNGEQMAANCVEGVRAALVWSDATARLAREHNDANMMAVGARQHSDDEAIALIDAFLETPFSGDERHQRRIDLMAAYERSVRA